MTLNRKASQLWIVNVLSFILFSVLGLTGLVNWLLLPRGYGKTGGLSAFLRHSLVEVHQWTALLFMLVIGIHLALHWSYIRKNLNRDGAK